MTLTTIQEKDLECPHCNSGDVHLDEASWLRDAMETWECRSCSEYFVVNYDYFIFSVEKMDEPEIPPRIEIIS